MPLSLVDRGIDPWVGVAAWLEAHKQNEFKYRPAQDATAVQRFGELTGATVLQILIPLLIVLLTFSAFSAEREQGTLRQLLSLGVNRSNLAAGKALGIGWALGTLLLPATMLGVLALALSSENGALLASGTRMALMGLSYLVYFGATIAVSSRGIRMGAFVAAGSDNLIGFWIFNSLIAPRAVADIAKAIYPTPSMFEFTQRMELALHDGTDKVTSRAARSERLRQELFKKYNVSKIEDLPVNLAGLRSRRAKSTATRSSTKLTRSCGVHSRSRSGSTRSLHCWRRFSGFDRFPWRSLELISSSTLISPALPRSTGA